MASSTPFQSGYQYSNVPNVDDPLSVSDGVSSSASTMTPNSGYPQQNLPPELHAPSTINSQQQQEQQRPRVYNPTYHEYPQTNSWNNVAGSGLNAPTWLISSGNYNEKRNRFMIGTVVLIFLLIVSHHHSETNTTIKGSKSTVPTGTGDVITNNSMPDNTVTPTTGNKGVAGDNPVPIPIPHDPIDKQDIGDDDDNAITNAIGDVITNANGDAITNSDIITNTNSVPAEPPTLTYLLTYPMSGTSYTVHLIEAATGTNTATNHDSFFVRSNDLIPNKITSDTPIPNKALSAEDASTSPFWHKQDLPYPAKHILTQTHCGGVKDFSRVLPSYAFDHQCRTVHNRDGNVTVTPRKHWDSKKRTIHLIRDPFSNVVSRFHAWRWEQSVLNNGERDFSFHKAKDEDKQKFRDVYCKKVDNMDMSGFVHADDLELRRLLRQIPCGLEFMKYVSWHMLAGSMKKLSDSMVRGVSNDGSTLSSAAAKSLTIYYEDFGSVGKTNTVVALIANFLDLDTVDFTKRPSFTGGRKYTDYFEPDERDAVGQLFKIMLAHEESTWDLLKVYL